jgi:O-antigen/teichoic acid export membrane protein
LEAAFLAHQRAEFIGATTAVGAVLNVGAGVLLLHHGYGAVSLVTVYSTVQLIMVLCYAVLLHRHIARLHWDFRLERTVHLLRSVRAFAASSVLGALLARPEVLLLSVLHSESQIGYYSAALQIVMIWQIIPETYMRNLYPVLSQQHVDRGCRDCDDPLLSQSIKYLFAMSLPLAAGIVAAADPIVRLLYGPGFGPSVPLVRIMAVGIPLTFLFELLWRLLAARDQQNLMLRAQVVMTAGRLAGGYALIGWLASLGAAVSTIAMMLAHNLLLGFYARSKGARFGIFRHAWRLSVAALAMGTFAALLVNKSQLWVVVVAAVVVYCGLIVLLGAFTPNELGELRRSG